MKKILLTMVVAAGIFLSNHARAQTLIGITNSNSVFTMANVSAPSVIGGPYTVSGVASGQTLVGIDSRPSTGEIYALGYDSVALMAQLYKITNAGTTYTATAVGSATSAVNLGVTNNAAFDFISSMDNQIRIVARNGNNYVMDANTGMVLTTGSSSLSFAVGDILAGMTNALAATAYINSFYGADITQEVGYDAINNVLVKFDAGTFANGFNNATYSLHSIGIGTGITFVPLSSIGMDTWYDNVSHSNTLYLSGRTLLGGTHLYQYNLSSTTGSLVDVGAIGSGSLSVRDIAFNTTGASTAPVTGQLVTALSLNMRRIVTFDAMSPGMLRSSMTITGLPAGQTMVAIDFGSNGMLYGMGYNSTSQTYQLYTIDTLSGNVTAVNTTPHSLALGTDDGSGNHVNVSFRFIPTRTNSIRVIGNSGATNAVIDASTGVVTATDALLTYVTGDASFGATANLTSVAYTGYNGDGTTQMFGYDANSGAMVMFDATNSTTGMGDGSSGYISTDVSLNTVLSLLMHNSTFNNSYMNIAYNAATSSNVGYLVSNYNGDSSDLLNYSILYDMTGMLSGYHKGTGATPVEVGSVGYGTPVKDATFRNSNGNPTGIGSVGGNIVNALPVYPNPVASSTRIALPAPTVSTVSVKIIDLNGVVNRTYEYASGTSVLDVDMSRLPMGLYSVRVTGKDIGFYNLKVVKE